MCLYTYTYINTYQNAITNIKYLDYNQFPDCLKKCNFVVFFNHLRTSSTHCISLFLFTFLYCLLETHFCHLFVECPMISLPVDFLLLMMFKPFLIHLHFLLTDNNNWKFGQISILILFFQEYFGYLLLHYTKRHTAFVCSTFRETMIDACIQVVSI